jgi:chromosome segregation ATPase
MTIPECVRSPKSREDPDFLINEYLIRNGYFDTIERIKQENSTMKKDRIAVDREISRLKRTIVSLDEELDSTRRRCAHAEETARDQIACYEKLIAEGRSREGDLLSIIQQQRSELEKCNSLLHAIKKFSQADAHAIVPSSTIQHEIAVPDVPQTTSVVLSPDSIMRGLSIIVDD